MRRRRGAEDDSSVRERRSEAVGGEWRKIRGGGMREVKVMCTMTKQSEREEGGGGGLKKSDVFRKKRRDGEGENE